MFFGKGPPWMIEEIKNEINYRNAFYQHLNKLITDVDDLDVVNNSTSELSSIIYQRKDEYYCHLAKKLNHGVLNFLSPPISS